MHSTYRFLYINNGTTRCVSSSAKGCFVNSTLWGYGSLSTVHYGVMAVCQQYTMGLWQSVNSTLWGFSLVNSTLWGYGSLSTVHYGVMAVCQQYTMGLWQSVNTNRRRFYNKFGTMAVCGYSTTTVQHLSGSSKDTDIMIIYFYIHTHAM